MDSLHCALLAGLILASLMSWSSSRCCDRCGIVRTTLWLLYAHLHSSVVFLGLCFYWTFGHTSRLTDPLFSPSYGFVVFLHHFLMTLLSYRGNMQTTRSTWHLKVMVSLANWPHWLYWKGSILWQMSPQILLVMFWQMSMLSAFSNIF